MCLPMQCSILEVQGDAPLADAVFHQQVQGEVLNEVLAVVAKWLAVERVQEGVARPGKKTGS